MRGTLGDVRRLDSLLLAGVGIMAIHQVAYSIAALTGSTSTVGHGHLELAWTLGGLLAILGLGSAVTSSLRRRRHEPLSTAVLSLGLGLGYVGLEMGERALDGYAASSLFGEAVFWIGLAAVVPVALLLRASVRTVADLVLHLATRPDELPRISVSASGTLPFARTRRTPIPLPVRSRPDSRRGPPFVR